MINKSKLGDEPIEQVYLETMNAFAGVLDKMFNYEAKGKEREVGFVLMVFPFGSTEGRVNYISNADRKTIVTLLKDQVARFEGQPCMKGNA